MTECTNCANEFSASEALCDDWRDPNKSYGCPKCGTFFIKDMRPRSSGGLIGGLIGGGIVTPAVFLLTDGFRADDVTTIVMSSVIIVTVFGILASKLMKLEPGLQVSPYRREKDDA